MYNIRLLDQNRRRIAVIEAPASWQYTRRPSEATNISVALPRTPVEDALPAGMDTYAFLAPYQVAHVGVSPGTTPHKPKHTHGDIGLYVEIYRGTQHIVTSRILKVDITDETIAFQCLTEEIELERHVTPAQYGRVYDHWDLADVARDMLHGWSVLRVKDQSQWEEAIEAVNVDTTTEPGVVMLAKSGGKYVAQGYIVLRFAKSDVPDFVGWDRIRWASDNGAPVRTTMQWRADDGSWSEEIEGALPDEIGVVPGTADAEVIDVRINLYTDDRETEDAEGNPVGQTPFVFAVELIARTEGRIEAGDIPASTGVLVSGLEADGASALNVLSQACAQAEWEFWVKDGKLNIAKEMGEDRTASVLLRAGTNMTVQTLSEGDDELVNVLVAYGPGEGINRLQVTRRHEESIAKYGEHRGVQTFEGAKTLADLIQAADDYLDEHAVPVPAYRVDVHYPYGTEPEYGCGDYVRVADPRNGIITRTRIAEEQRDYTTSGLRTTLYLGMPAPDLARTVRPTEPPRPVRPPDKPVISVTPIPGGIRVIDTKAPSIRWSTSEVHVSTTKGFTPSAETLVADGRRVRFDVGGLTPDTRYYVRLIRFDTDGNPSEPSDEMSAVAAKFPQEELPADLFQIKATSDVEPDSGTLENLWDQDTTTGAAWASGPVTVTFEYPMQWFFDMVRLYTTTGRAYYVEARTKEGAWAKVTGDHMSVANGYTVQRFANNKMVVSDALRITFPGAAPVDLRELKFWTVTLADEILAQKLRLTGDMAIESQDGRAIVGPLVSGGFGFSAENAAGDRSELTEGRLAFYKAGSQAPFFYVRHIEYGTAEAGEQVNFDFPFESPPRVLVAVQRLTAYDASVGRTQVWSVFPENVTETGFVPRARLEVAGAEGAETAEYSSGTRPGQPAFQIFSGDPGYPTSMAPVGVESMSFRFRLTVSGGNTGAFGYVSLYVYKDGQSWQSTVPIASHGLNFGTQTYTASISNLDTNARYRWALAAFGMPAPPPIGGPIPSVKVDMLRWDWAIPSLIIDQSGSVQWIAVENERL